jgi:hypothetical protein
MRNVLVLLMGIVLVVGFPVSGVLAKMENAEYNKLVKELKNNLKQGNWIEVESCIEQLAGDNSPRVVKFYLKLAKNTDIHLDVFRAVKKALAEMTDAKARAAMYKKASSGPWQIKVMLADILGKIGEKDEEAVKTLIKLLSDREELVILRAASSLGNIGNKNAVKPLIDALKKNKRTKSGPFREINIALRKISGKFIEEYDEWVKWYADGKGLNDCHPKNYKPGALDGTRPKFFDVDVASRRIIFIIDTSGSMKVDDRNPSGRLPLPTAESSSTSRIEIVKMELIEVIKELDSKTAFNIISFNSGVSSWQKALVKANKANRSNAIEYLHRLNPMSQTFTNNALKRAFEDKKADTIFLLTDGVPTHSGDRKDASRIILNIYDFVGKVNRFREVKIFTFAFKSMRGDEHGKEAFKFLKRLAKDNNGTFKAIESKR